MPKGSERFNARRRLRRRRVLIGLSILFVLVAALALYGLYQRPVRIHAVTISGADQSLAALATSAMQGSYLGIIPRDSIFFYPASEIRAEILAAHPEVAAISIARSSFSSLSIRVDERVPVARWCGAALPVAFDATASTTFESLVATNCYYFDASGLLYGTSSPSTPINPFLLYEPLADGTSTEPASAAGTTLPSAHLLPATFDFARQLATLGGQVLAISIVDGEVDDYLASGTRVTYVLGSEQSAFTALESARANFNLADGSLDYVDLRFDGKVYIKPRK